VAINLFAEEKQTSVGRNLFAEGMPESTPVATQADIKVAQPKDTLPDINKFGPSTEPTPDTSFEESLMKHPNVYGAYGVVKEMGKMIPWTKYIDPEERERFNKLSTQKQTRELLLEDLNFVILGKWKPISEFAKQVGGATLKRFLPKTFETLTKQRTLGRVKPPVEAPVSAEKPPVAPIPEKPTLEGAVKEKVVSEAQPVTETVGKLEVIEGTGEIKTRGLARGVEQKAIEKKLTESFGDLPEYKTVSMKDQAKKASDLLTENPSKAKRVAMGEELPPEGILPESVFVAVEDSAIAAGDAVTLRALATQSNLTSEATVMGQRIRTLAERNPESPVTAIADIAKARQKSVKGMVKDTGKEIETVSKQIGESIKKTLPKRGDWVKFIESIRC